MPRTHLRWDPNASPVIPGVPPAAPGWVTSIAFDGGAVVSWDTSQGGGAVQSWVVTPFIAGAAQAVTSGTTANGRATVSGLTNSTAYTFQVQVINQAGTALSPMSAANTPLANLIFGDDFNGAVLDPSWQVVTRDGDQTNSELQYYLPSQVTLDGSGHVVLTLAGTQVRGLTYADGNPPTYAGAQVTRPYVSGMIQWAWPGALATGSGAAQALSQFTQPGFNFTYGKIQVSMQVANLGGTGTVTGSAAWMLGSQCQQATPLNPDNVGTCNWHAAGSEELDICQFEGGSVAVYQANFATASGTGTQVAPSVTNASTTFHTYEIDWSAGSAQWVLDGASQGTALTAGIPSTPMALILQATISAGGTPPLTQPATSIDWVRVFHN